MSIIFTEQQFVTFSADQHQSVRVLINVPAKLTSSGSNWETVDRIRRSGMTLWRGRDPVQQTVGVLFDGYIDSVDQSIAMDNLDKLGRPVGDNAPPAVHISGDIRRPDITDWIILSIEWGDDVIKDVINGSVVTLRQDAVVTLEEFIAADRLKLAVQSGGTKTTTPAKPKPKRKFHTVAPGDSLQSIAVSEYGDASRWRDIARANNIRDPAFLTTGKVLRMP